MRGNGAGGLDKRESMKYFSGNSILPGNVYMVTDAGMNDEKIWEHLLEPPPEHPDRELLWEAEKALRSIEELSENPDIKHAFARRLEEYTSEIQGVVKPIQTTEHSIAFMGNIGVGKTTAICRITGLEVSTDGKTALAPVLDVGAGGITVCEVALVQGDNYAISIEPRSEEEIHREVREFARYHIEALESHQEESEDADSHGISKEIERAIRNMSGLSSRPRVDGRRVPVDLAKNLAESLSDLELLETAILEKMNLQERTTREISYSQEIGKDPLVWLKDTFAQVNNGRHPEFSLPKSIEIKVPKSILAEESLSVRIVDTKGIDDTAEREDLESHFREPNTVVILCSGFNEAPSPSVQQLLKRGVEGQFPNIGDKVAVLPLPKLGEALAVKDDQGFAVDAVAEGYELKIEQAEMRLNGQHIPFGAIKCFNANEDDPNELRDFLLDLVRKLREKQSRRLQEAITSANAMVLNFESEQASEVLRSAGQRLSIWLRNNGELGSLSGNLQDSLFLAMLTVHPSSLRASINRGGEWHKLDYPYQLGYGARVVAIQTLSRKRQGFREITQNLLDDPDLEGAHGLVGQARSIFESGVNGILSGSQSIGREVHSLYLEPDGGFWVRCYNEWGRGSGYRDRVSRHHERWFADPIHGHIQATLRASIHQQWQQILERVLAILPED